MIYPEQKTIFVHIPRCGGRSIKHLLRVKFGESNYNNRIELPIKYDLKKNTFPFQKIESFHEAIPIDYYDKIIDKNKKFLKSDTIKQCYIFTSVRNPYDRFISLFVNMIKRHDFCKKPEDVFRLNFIRQSQRPITNFLMFIRNVINKFWPVKSIPPILTHDISEAEIMILPQASYIKSEKYKISNQIKDFSSVSIRIGKTKYKKSVFDYLIEEPESFDIINNIYNEDFEVLDYNRISTTQALQKK